MQICGSVWAKAAFTLFMGKIPELQQDSKRRKKAIGERGEWKKWEKAGCKNEKKSEMICKLFVLQI